ncbi:hypothetical protein AB0301_09140 [Microbacterium profundi]|jgi:hypothetical protein|uniref:Uncharacterized protein n=1 Tax=Microbacterium profundi TaxID=450380 RepID=A0ABV3LH43_9MICO
MSRFRLVSTLVVVVMSIVALTPWSYETRIGTVPVINIMLTAIMFVGFIVLIIDLIVTRDSDAAAVLRQREERPNHGR